MRNIQVEDQRGNMHQCYKQHLQSMHVLLKTRTTTQLLQTHENMRSEETSGLARLHCGKKY